MADLLTRAMIQFSSQKMDMAWPKTILAYFQHSTGLHEKNVKPQKRWSDPPKALKNKGIKPLKIRLSDESLCKQILKSKNKGQD